jgi:N-acetylglutamate synthase-like GNAT family acetyltransferase
MIKSLVDGYAGRVLLAKEIVTLYESVQEFLVAEADGEVVGFLAYRIDWFQCTFVSLVVVRDDFRRKGIAREFFKSVEAVSPTPRLYSSTEETNAVSIQMHRALGFQPSGHIDNLPQGVRELLFYKRIPPRSLGSTS